MKAKKNYPFLLIILLSLTSFNKVFACHGTVLVNLTATISATDLTIDANSDAATCGCGPYFMEVEIIPATGSYTGNPPLWTSASWGTAPWFHSILNVPGYSAPNWADNCALEPYTSLVIPFSALCPGTNYKWRIREFATAGSAGAWSPTYTLTTPGSPVSPTLNPTATSSTICSNSGTFLDAFGNNCSGPGTFSWAPSASLSSPNASSTNASPTVTTTYTVTFYDQIANQTFIDSVTVNVVPPMTITSSWIEAACNGNNGSASVNVTGGNSPYTYYWLPTMDTTSFISNSSNTGYDVSITDNSGCMQTVHIIIGDSCNLVWPGDVNDDSIANNLDFLDLALAYGATGTQRTNQSIVWNGYPSADWGQTSSSGVDYKSADCNGDGSIDANDTNAILLNYGLYHTFRYGQTVYNSSLPDLQIHFTQDSIAAGGTTGIAQIILGSSLQQAANIYGLAFTLHFDPQQIDVLNTRCSPVNSWLGTPGADLLGIDHADNATAGNLDVAIARIDHTDRSGQGIIASLYFRTTSDLIGSGNSVLVPFSISNVKVISANDSVLQVNNTGDTIRVFDDIALGLPSSGEVQNLQVYPNPSGGIFTLTFSSATMADYKIEIMNSLGQLVFSETATDVKGTVQKEINLTQQTPGLYLVKISGNNGIATQKILTH